MRNLKKSLSMKDELLDNIKADVAKKDKLDREILELKKLIEVERNQVKTVNQQLSSSRDEVKKI